VSPTRVLARKLKPNIYQTTRAEQNKRVMSWAVPDSPNGSWTENFSPQLSVTKIRVFKESNGSRTYLAPDTIRVARPSSDGSDDTLGSRPACFPDQNDRTEFSISVFCEDAASVRTVTPAYYGSDLENPGVTLKRIRWDVEFTTPSAAEPLDDVYIEFSVGLGLGTRAMRLSSELTSFGVVQVGKSKQGLTSVENTGSATIQIDGVQVVSRRAGETPSDFRAVPAGGRTLPVMLLPNASLDIDVYAEPTSTGQKQAGLQVTANGGQLVVTGALGANAAAPELQVILGNPSLSFPYPCGRQPPCSRAAFLIQSVGSLPLTRRIELTDTMNFRMTSGASQNAPATVNVLAPVTTELVWVEYTPSSFGVHSAELRITSDGGDAIFPIVGRLLRALTQ
ncbi:MAG: choice-of-anchor D domain-containing protein, partial [Candidatus Binataceae bacterium]